MSDHKPTENQYNEDMKALFDLLDRLEKRDEKEQQQIYIPTEPIELITVDDTEEEPMFYQPDDETAVDTRDLLLTDTEETLKMSEYLLLDESKKQHTDGDRELPQRPANRRNPFKALWVGFCGNFPRKEDSVGTKARKCGFLTSLLVMIAAIAYLAMDLVVIPTKNEQLQKELISLYHPDKAQIVVSKEEAAKNKYPANMLASFADLYERNDDVRGWITYRATGDKDFLNIDYPIVYSGDNSEYLRKDFNGDKNRNGTLFFDENNKVNSYKDENRSLIVYGHNMASGQMFAGLNKLMGSVNNARAAATLTMSTLFREDTYEVFAVILTDESDRKKNRYFNTRRTQFEDDEDFLNYIDQMRARSLFDYPAVVQPDDQILVLSTCTGKTSAHVKDGRLVVVARRVRDGESVNIRPASIVKNTDVIMPYYWYLNQKKVPHKYYTDLGYGTESTDTTDGSTAPTEGDTTATTVEGTDVTESTLTTESTETGSTDSTASTESTDTTDSTTSTVSTTTVTESEATTTVTTAEPTTTTKKTKPIATTIATTTATTTTTTTATTTATTTVTAGTSTATETTTASTTTSSTTKTTTTATTTAPTTTTTVTTTTTTTAPTTTTTATTTTTTAAPTTTTTTTTSAPTTTATATTATESEATTTTTTESAE